MHDEPRVVLRRLHPRPVDGPGTLPVQHLGRGRPGRRLVRSALRAAIVPVVVVTVIASLAFNWQDRSVGAEGPLLLALVPDVGRLATDGRVVGYSRPAGEAMELVVRSLVTGEELVFATSRSIEAVTIANGLVAWQERDCPDCPGRVRVRGVDAREDLFAATTNDERLPRLADNRIVWVSRSGHDRIYLADIRQRPVAVTIEHVASDRVAIESLTLDGGYLAWIEVFPDGVWHLRRQALLAPDGVETLLAGRGVPPVFHLAGPVLVTAGERVVLHGFPQAATPITLGAIADPHLFACDGRYLFWLDPAAPGQPEPAIVAFDLLSGSRFVAVPRSAETVALAAAGGWLVWASRAGAETAVWASPVHDLLPTAPRPASADVPAGWRYFPHTQHYAANGFLAFWERYGGLEVFGYPLSEEFDELDPTSGQFRTVQYFERARFAWSPGTPDAHDGVALDNLGLELAERLALTETRAFRPQQPAVQGHGGCRWFPETQHAACGGFLVAWLATGETVRWATASSAEARALVLNGRPIGEPMASPDGTTVQYFERARLEYRQSSDGTTIVARGRIGAELLQIRGW